MRVSIVGGTGDFGEGLAVRLGLGADHDVVVGSRDESKARSAAERYRDCVEAAGGEPTITGAENGAAVRRSDVAILSVPPYYVRETIDAIEAALSAAEPILVTPAVGISGDDEGVRYDPPPDGSVTELVAAVAPESVPVVGAFHSLPAERLADPSAELGVDTLLVGDDPTAKAAVADLAEGIDGLRPIDAGPLSNAAEVEAVTPLLINLGRYADGFDDVGVAFR